MATMARDKFARQSLGGTLQAHIKQVGIRKMAINDNH